MISQNLQKRIYHLINFYYLFGGFLFAVFFTNIEGRTSFYLFLFIFVLFCASILFNKKLIISSFFVFIGVLCGFLISNNNNDNIENSYQILTEKTLYYTKKTLIEGEVEDLYKENEFYKIYIFKINNLDSESINSQIKLLLNIPVNMELKYGAIINFESKISRIEKINNFDYDKYMLLRNVYGKAYGYKINIISNHKSFISGFIDNTKKQLLQKIVEIYPNKEAGIISGVLIGDGKMINPETKTFFNKAGLSHILVVSGYNITILIIFLSFFIKFLPRFLQIIIVFVFIGVFLGIVGINNTPALRASIMGFIGFLGTIYGRKINIYSILSLVTIIFIINNPLALNYDISLHLSIFALLGIITGKEKIDKILEKIPKLFFIKDILTTTIAVMIFVLPFMIINFGEFSIVAPISNIFILPIIPILMLSGGTSLVIYFLDIKLGILTGFISWIFVRYIIVVGNFFGNLQFSTLKIDFGLYNKYFFVGYYLVLFFLLCNFFIKNNEEIFTVNKETN